MSTTTFGTFVPGVQCRIVNQFNPVRRQCGQAFTQQRFNIICNGG
jgi:hypothetical protein